MEISTEKTKLIINSTTGIQSDIKVKGQMLETVLNFKNFGEIVSVNDSNKDCFLPN